MSWAGIQMEERKIIFVLFVTKDSLGFVISITIRKVTIGTYIS